MLKQILPAKQLSIYYLKAAISTWHGRIVLAGMAVGLIYFQTWLSNLFVRASQGSAGIPLMGAAVYLGLSQLWRRRNDISQLKALDEDRFLGCLLIICGVLAFPFCQFAVWPQSIVWLIILAGIAICLWGIPFFAKYPLPTLLMVITVYPKPGVFARNVWHAFTPYQFLELIMAQAGTFALKLFGFPAVRDGIYIFIPPDGAVEVGFGCNGFNMAFTMAVTALIMGLLYNQRWPKILVLITLGIVLALLFNIPRIFILAIASIYWDEKWFDFWHGGWGSQIFTAILFTPYYYAATAIIKCRPRGLCKS